MNECCSQCLTKFLHKKASYRVEREPVCNSCFDFETKYRRIIVEAKAESASLELKINTLIENDEKDIKKKRMYAELGTQLLLKLDSLGYLPNFVEKKELINHLNSILDKLDAYTFDERLSVKRIEKIIHTYSQVPIYLNRTIFNKFISGDGCVPFVWNYFFLLRIIKL